LVAWTPHLAGVALKLDQPPPMAARAAPSAPPRRWPVVAVGLAVALLLAANLALTADLHRRLPTDRPTLPVASAPDQQPPTPTRQPVEPAADEPAERLAQALHQYLSEQGVLADLPAGLLLHEYDRLASRDEGLRVRGEKGQQALGALAVLARRSPAQVEATVREALANKGYDPALVNLIAQRVHQRLADGRGP
jgi:hypothetical protein